MPKGRFRCCRLADTLAHADGMLGEPVDRKGLVRVQTPQAFQIQKPC